MRGPSTRQSINCSQFLAGPRMMRRMWGEGNGIGSLLFSLARLTATSNHPFRLSVLEARTDISCSILGTACHPFLFRPLVILRYPMLQRIRLSIFHLRVMLHLL
mmetsp:Transcript_97567/g.276015  ORF Transcript_97567/g.276015 Transcript_97567/m.276015 type:complete len:104 (+) Transcript_97567:988-1299(+)